MCSRRAQAVTNDAGASGPRAGAVQPGPADGATSDARRGRAQPPRGADAILRAEYREIEQVLALLMHAPDVDDETLKRFAANLNAHLEAAETVVYPFVERVRKRPLADERVLVRRLRASLARVTVAGIATASRRRRLEALAALVRAHARLDERSTLPCVGEAIDSISFEPHGGRDPPVEARRARRGSAVPPADSDDGSPAGSLGPDRRAHSDTPP